MSDMWLGAPAGTRFAARSAAPPVAFVPWARRLAEPIAATPVDEDEEEPLAPAPVIDPEAIALDGFARGFEEGRRLAAIELAEERAACARLLAAADALRPEPPAALARLLAETVDGLVRRIVGEAGVDAALLAARAEAAAALVTQEARPARMRLHPEDAARLADAALPVTLIADESLVPGAIVVESRDGWIEDGPQVALDRLRAELERL